jgi:hypothetical protein
LNKYVPIPPYTWHWPFLFFSCYGWLLTLDSSSHSWSWILPLDLVIGAHPSGVGYVLLLHEHLIWAHTISLPTSD